MENDQTRRKSLEYFRKDSNSDLSYSISLGSGSPHLIICGGLHGNEFVGVDAMLETHCNLRNTRLQGQITFMLGNPAAYAEDKRYLDSNLNRAFVSGLPGNYREVQRAKEIEHFLSAGKDIKGLLDLHSVSIGDFRVAIYQAGNARNQKLASEISQLPLHFMYHQEHLSGLLVDYASSLGIDALAMECGNHYSTGAKDIARLHIDNFLKYYGVIGDGLKVNHSKHRSYETISAIRPGKGFHYLGDVQSEMLVRGGKPFAYDAFQGYHRAPRDCYLMMPSKEPQESDSDAGFLCLRKDGG
jgi:predicted deacylase